MLKFKIFYCVTVVRATLDVTCEKYENAAELHVD